MLYRKNRNVDLTPVIKESFKYSFFPPVDMVLEFYNKMRKTRFNNIFDFKDEFNKRFDERERANESTTTLRPGDDGTAPTRTTTGEKDEL